MTEKKFFKDVFIFLMITPFLFSQVLKYEYNTQHEILNPNINNITAHNLKSDRPVMADSLSTGSKKFRMKKSPAIAVLLSAAVPGAGQFYNQSYWKIPVIAGLVGYFGYEYFNNNSKYKDYRSRYNTSITPENPFGDLNLKSLREFYRDQRDDFIWYFLIVYVVNLVDAYVDAHLFDFNVSQEKLTRLGKTDRELKFMLNYNF